MRDRSTSNGSNNTGINWGRLAIESFILTIPLLFFVTSKFVNQIIAIMLFTLFLFRWLRGWDRMAWAPMLLLFWVIIYALPVDLAIRSGGAFAAEVLPVHYRWWRNYNGPERCMLYPGSDVSDAVNPLDVNVRWVVLFTLPTPIEIRTPLVEPAVLHHGWSPPEKFAPGS